MLKTKLIQSLSVDPETSLADAWDALEAKQSFLSSPHLVGARPVQHSALEGGTDQLLRNEDLSGPDDFERFVMAVKGNKLQFFQRFSVLTPLSLGD